MTDNVKKVFRVIGLIFIAVGAIFAIIGGASEGSMMSVVSGSIIAVGGVVALIKSFL